MAQIWSPYLYDSKYSPQYTVAFATNTVMAGIAVAGCFALRFCLQRDNRKMQLAEDDSERSGEIIDPAKRIRYVL